MAPAPIWRSMPDPDGNCGTPFAVEHGLGTHIKTGAVMADPVARASIGARDGERVVALVNIGVPADVPDMSRRDAASTFTTWVP